MPGVLQIEALAQTGAILALSRPRKYRQKRVADRAWTALNSAARSSPAMS